MASEQSIGALEAIIERRSPNAFYHRWCMRILDTALPKGLLDVLPLAVIEAAAEEEKDSLGMHVALAGLSARILYMMKCDMWEQDEWAAALVANNMYAIQSHHAAISDSKQYDLLAQSVNGLLWQNVYRDALEASLLRQQDDDGNDSQSNATYYLSALFNFSERTLLALFAYMTNAEGQLPPPTSELIQPLVEETIEAIVRDATTQ